MSAEMLRRAAALIRERAGDATPGPWAVEDWPVQPDRWQVYDQADPEAGIGETVGVDMVKPDADHIASWHPAVALAVADWLDETALRWEWVEERELALAVAVAYLGEEAP